MAKRKPQSIQAPDDAFKLTVLTLFPNEKERTELLQSALLRLHPDVPKGDEFNTPINAADLLKEMLQIRRARDLVRLIIAMNPEHVHHLGDLLKGCSYASVTECAHVYGVSESTVCRWISEGMPVGNGSN